MSSQADSQAGPKMVIWGTDVDVSECKKTFRRFIENFIDPNLEPDEANLAITNVNEPIYMQKMKEVPNKSIVLYFCLDRDSYLV